MPRGIDPGHRIPFDPSVWRRMTQGGLDTAQVKRATVGWEGESSHYTINAGQDVDVRVTTEDGMLVVARLAASGGLWAIPPAGEECTVEAPQGDWTTVGAPVCRWTHHGPPSNLSASRRVLDVPGTLYVGNGATKAAARVDDTTDDGSLQVTAAGNILGITYTPPGGAPTMVQLTFTLAAGVIAITAAPSPWTASVAGKINSGSAKTSIE